MDWRFVLQRFVFFAPQTAATARDTAPAESAVLGKANMAKTRSRSEELVDLLEPGGLDYGDMPSL